MRRYTQSDEFLPVTKWEFWWSRQVSFNDCGSTPNIVKMLLNQGFIKIVFIYLISVDIVKYQSFVTYFVTQKGAIGL
jgi:hypothetical protein